jgi:hypothetical protein
VLEAGLTMAEQDSSMFLAAKETGSMLGSLASDFFSTVAAIVERAQQAGLVRADLKPEDLPRLVIMLISTIRLTAEPHDGWRRYLTLLLDGLRPAAATKLPPAPPLWFSPFDNDPTGC